MQKITPFLWFDTQAEEAVNYYVSVFKDSKVKDMMRYTSDNSEVSGQPEGSVLTVSFELNGQDFVALNGGPHFKFTEAVSFMVMCEDQAEIDYFWDKLSAVPESEQCGWCKDKFGLSWQVVPKNFSELISSPAGMKAMMNMKKFDIAALQAAK